jgi:hypothetical protein
MRFRYPVLVALALASVIALGNGLAANAQTVNNQFPPDCYAVRVGDQINVITTTHVNAASYSPKQEADTERIIQLINEMTVARNPGDPDSVLNGVGMLDTYFNQFNHSCAGYQSVTPTRQSAIVPPSAFGAQRIVWSSLGWLQQLPEASRTAVENRLIRLRCQNNEQFGVCVYVLRDVSAFQVNDNFRGFLLNRPLNPECDFGFWAQQAVLCTKMPARARVDEPVTITFSRFPADARTLEFGYYDMSFSLTVGADPPVIVHRFQSSRTYFVYFRPRRADGSYIWNGCHLCSFFTPIRIGNKLLIFPLVDRVSTS